MNKPALYRQLLNNEAIACRVQSQTPGSTPWKPENIARAVEAGNTASDAAINQSTLTAWEMVDAVFDWAVRTATPTPSFIGTLIPLGSSAGALGS